MWFQKNFQIVMYLLKQYYTGIICWLFTSVCFIVIWLVPTTDLEPGTLRTEAPEIVGNEHVCPSNGALPVHCHTIIATGSPAS